MAKKSMKLGGGGRFAKVEAAAAAGGAKDAAAVAAMAGMQKYGKAKMQEMAQKGRKRAMSMKAGNTEYSVKRTSKSSQAEGIEEYNETFDPNFPSASSTFTKIAGTETSQVKEIPAALRGKVPKGY